MAKSCKELFAGIECTIIGNADEKVEGIAYRSDKVKAGDAFFCIVGMKVDGHSFAQDAIDHGAHILVVERTLYLADATNVVEVVVSDTRKAMAAAAANFYDQPSHSFDLVGITGTNGKTTTTYLVDHIVSSSGCMTGAIGTIGMRIGKNFRRAEHTTPESCDLQGMLAEMRDAGCDEVAMEVSSHALDLKRTWGTKFAVTAFSNLTQDHLDYHKTFEAYFEAKALLFSSDYPARRVICIDDKWGRELLHRCSKAGEKIISTGFTSEALIHVVDVSYATTHTDVTLDVCGVHRSFTYPLVGRFNVSNVMLAFGIALQLGIDADTIIKALSSAPQVPGRLQRIHSEHEGNLSVFVDYAHTPDALIKAISSVKHLTDGQTYVVFGCGGDRDKTKRPIMGQAALNADYAIVTSDNPRTEDPDEIIHEVVEGMAEGTGRFSVEPDRRRAIALAINKAPAGSSILVAGKGHEDYQLIGSEVRHFSDSEVVAEELEQAFGSAQE
ncbi:MAG: UDP-N-acetylmuramoyl-L-alanyl-D-glutamate--2,6-diaminopimelate ligase [Eggerthellaceae bacterium]|jgi:UDP-N-acetylmuramoyl-L-alanyl-D-glutamate--2,6-diaminopimelate ligase|nr:UDP-N-acetylmuramoyl-L-alanyl-D-glutamate--2,6-diaminopimelate ligase [Eggerthellaceae bacterium]MCH4220885.1 UDP-N-acetylmuramoyl-L-alanyl-D-glutamate--2,6-diaminopimelate ligase [Eggerthellaceae bacterium]